HPALPQRALDAAAVADPARPRRSRLHGELPRPARGHPPHRPSHARAGRRRVRHLSALALARIGARAARVSARQTLIDELREHALVIGEVTLTSGRKAGYLIDAKRAILRPAGFTALAELTAAEARQCGAQAVGGITMGADPIACAALAGGADVDAFFVRKERKEHGLSRWIEGPLLEPGTRCLVVEDVVTTGGSTIKAIDRVRADGFEVCGVMAILDRLAGGADAIREAANGAPYTALTTIDDVYPERPDR